MLTSLDPALHAPERLPFIRKLRNFLEDHGFESAPTLVLQCDIQDAQVADIGSRQLAQALLNGAGQSDNSDWWSGFMGGDTFNVFDGLASKGNIDDPRWATELHQDGHVLAGIRLSVYQDLKGVHPAILSAFTHFGLLVQKLHAAASIQGKLKLTATLVNGKGLGLVTFPQYGQPRIRNIGRDVLEWPVLTTDLDDGIGEACMKMRAQMQRAFP